jgi:hypothetical protein
VGDENTIIVIVASRWGEASPVRSPGEGGKVNQASESSQITPNQGKSNLFFYHGHPSPSIGSMVSIIDRHAG